MLRYLLYILGSILLCSPAAAGTNRAANAEFVRQVTVASTRVAQVERALLDTEAKVDQLAASLRKRGQQRADRVGSLDQLSAELSELRGLVETLRFDVDTLRATYESTAFNQDARQLHAEQRLDQLEDYLGVTPPPPPILDPTGTGLADPTQAASTEPNPSPAPQTAAAALDLAKQHLANDNQPAARAVLTKAIADFPEATEVAEMRYHLGETWFNQSSWSKAVRTFEQVISNHRSSDWAAWSMLRQGECFEAMDQKEDAKLFYSEVVRGYPQSAAAKEAQTRLAD